MPFIQRIVSPVNLSSLSTKSDEAINNDINSTIQISFVNLLRQIGDLAKHSENIIMQIFNDSLNVAERWQCLERRLDAIKTNVDRLNANSIEISNASAGNVARFIEVEKHYSSTLNKEDESETTKHRLFVADTRPGHIKDLCQLIRTSSTNKKRSVLVDFEDGSTQTDDNFRRFRRSTQHVKGVEDSTTTTKLLSTSQIDSKHSSSASESFLSSSSVDETSNYFASQRTTTDNSKQKLILNNSSAGGRSPVAGVTVEVDTSGIVLRRMSALRKKSRKNHLCAPIDEQPVENSSTTFDKRAKAVVDAKKLFSDEERSSPTNVASIATAPRKFRRCSRRNTIAGVVDLKNVDDNHKRSKDKDLTSSTSNYVDERDEFDMNHSSIADEYLYDFAPFYRRRTKRSMILSSVNQFFSLRRPKDKKPSKITTSTTLQDFRKTTPNLEYLNSSLIIPSQKRQQKDQTTPTPTSTQNVVKQFFKRTLSLHLSSTRKTSKRTSSNEDNDYLYESFPFRRPTKAESVKNGCTMSPEIIGGSPRNYSTKSSSSTGHFSRNYSRPKSNLPITMESQVLNVAAVLRNHSTTTKKQNQKNANNNFKSSSPSSSRDSAYSSCGKKIRPMSIVSFGSIASLDLNEKNLHNSWYRQGYQLEYPDECLDVVNVKPSNEPMKISSPRLIVSTVPSDMFGRKMSSSKPSPYSDVSSINDSNYSCDHEGYFTSMHRDSGLIHVDAVNVARTPKMLVGLNDFRGRSFSTHSSSSTVAGEPNDGDCMELLPDRSPAASVIDSSNESTSSTSILLKEKMVDVSSLRAFPPLCDVSLSESSGNETLKRNRRRYHESSTSPTTTVSRMSAETCARIDAFDRWLLSKFQAEMTLKQKSHLTGGCTNGWSDRLTGHSLPRRRKETNNNDILHDNESIVDHYDETIGNFNNTMPRKSVRFLD